MVAVRPEGAPRPSGDIRSRSIVAVVVLAALVLGYVLGATSGLVSDGGELGAGDETTTSEAATTTTTTFEPNLGQLVPGFEGVLITLGGESRDLELLVWHPDRASPSSTRLPPGTTVVPDASGRLLAGLGEMSRGSLFYTLYAGTPGSLWPVTAGATSFSWHATDPGRIAWLEHAGGGSGLHLGTGFMNDAGRFVPGTTVAPVALIGQSAVLVGWGDWGYLVRGFAEERTVYLLDVDGSERWRMAADNASVLAGDRIVLRRDRLASDEIHFVFTTPDAAATEPPSTIVRTFPYHRRDHFSREAWSLDGEHIAFLRWDSLAGTWHIEVWQQNGVLREAISVGDRLLSGISWSPDGRFIIAPAELFDSDSARYVVMFYDTRLGTISDVPMPHWVQTAFVRQPDGPADGGGLGASPAPSQ